MVSRLHDYLSLRVLFGIKTRRSVLEGFQSLFEPVGYCLYSYGLVIHSRSLQSRQRSIRLARIWHRGEHRVNYLLRHLCTRNFPCIIPWRPGGRPPLPWSHLPPRDGPSACPQRISHDTPRLLQLLCPPVRYQQLSLNREHGSRCALLCLELC